MPKSNVPKESLLSRAFLLLCLSHALFAASFNMIIPELPGFLTAMGGAEYKGWIIALFTLTAGLSRPFSGKLADTVGRLPVMYVGTFACILCGISYPAFAWVGGFLFLRFLHGFSTGFKPTGTAAYVADIIPTGRLGEAMGLLGISFSLGVSASPPLGYWLATQFSTTAMFYTSAFVALLSVLILLQLPETLHSRKKFQWRDLKISRSDIVDPLAFPAGIVMIGCYVSYGVLLTLIPDFCDHIGITNRGIFFTIFTISSVSTRFFAGKISDTLGRTPVLKVSALVIALAMVLFAYARTHLDFYLASVVFGLGNGIFSPAINAWTIDLGNPGYKGRALATMYIALEIAIGGGALFAGWHFANRYENMPAVFLTAAALSVLSFGYLTIWHPRVKLLEKVV